MKLDKRRLYEMMNTVVPHEGTWIEIPGSHPHPSGKPVVPHEGTWIEIHMERIIIAVGVVVPHEGTWIEIDLKSFFQLKGRSFPTRERGLK